MWYTKKEKWLTQNDFENIQNKPLKEIKYDYNPIYVKQRQKCISEIKNRIQTEVENGLKYIHLNYDDLKNISDMLNYYHKDIKLYEKLKQLHKTRTLIRFQQIERKIIKAFGEELTNYFLIYFANKYNKKEVQPYIYTQTRVNHHFKHFQESDLLIPSKSFLNIPRHLITSADKTIIPPLFKKLIKAEIKERI